MTGGRQRGDDTADEVRTLERVTTPTGEVALRRRAGVFEIVSNGVFLMDTADGTSERLLVDAAVERCTADALRVLIGGLGVGFSLQRALAHERVAAVDVVEIEPVVVAWHERHLRVVVGDVTKDARVRVVVGDVLEVLAATDERYDAVCLDTDNGPDWLVTPSNAALYDERGLTLVSAVLRDGGVLAMWSAAPSPALERRLREHFDWVEVLDVPTDRGQPDVVYVATTPPGLPDPSR